MAAIERKQDYTQVVVWPCTVLGVEHIEEFEQWVNDTIGARCQFLESVTTKPNFGEDDTLSGGREDVIFAIHRDDIAKFAVRRLGTGMRWVEDVLDNETRTNKEMGIPEDYSIYPAHVKEYRTW